MTPELKVFDVTLSLAIKLSVQPSGADDNTTMSRQCRGEHIRSSWNSNTALTGNRASFQVEGRGYQHNGMALQYRGEHIRSGWISNAALTGNYTFYPIERR